jgi:ATP-dependent DNA helicase PIF1
MTSLVVWDEAPMNNRCFFEALGCSLRDVLTNDNELPNDKLFGGKSILLGGDFR